MSNALYESSVPVFTKMLGNLSALIDKAASFCETRKIDPSVLINARLAPDMFPLSRQVQIACDSAKRGAGLLAGAEIPKHEDNEKTFAELKARIKSTVDFIASCQADKMAGRENADIIVPIRQPIVMKSGAFLRNFTLPNFYFHVAAAYAILRHNGVDLGKRDYLGSLQ